MFTKLYLTNTKAEWIPNRRTYRHGLKKWCVSKILLTPACRLAYAPGYDE